MKIKLLILFGKAGAGKNHVAKIFEKEFGYYFYDADQDLTEEMINCIKYHLNFTDDMRNKYFEIIKNRIKELIKDKNKVILTQGLFRNKNRNDLIKEFQFANFIWVEAENNILEKRVAERKSDVTIDYARKINKFFENPNFNTYKLINNSTDEEILVQAHTIENKINEVYYTDLRSRQITTA
jgi:gluconate kinase